MKVILFFGKDFEIISFWLDDIFCCLDNVLPLVDSAFVAFDDYV